MSNDFNARQRVRSQALELAVRSLPPTAGLPVIGRQAHYFAHYITGGSQPLDCDPTCPFREPQPLP